MIFKKRKTLGRKKEGREGGIEVRREGWSEGRRKGGIEGKKEKEQGKSNKSDLHCTIVTLW